jgi:hypothetical protein
MQARISGVLGWEAVPMSNMEILFLAAIGFIFLLVCMVPIAFLPWRRSARGQSQ